MSVSCSLFRQSAEIADHNALEMCHFKQLTPCGSAYQNLFGLHLPPGQVFTNDQNNVAVSPLLLTVDA